jgi:1-aminocyclopropane-1-carboxylate synthase
MVLSIAENTLSLDLMGEKIRSLESELPLSQYNYGNDEIFRKYLARFLERTFFKRPLDIKNIVVANGAAPILNMVAYTFCDPGEAVIIPSPYYAGFDWDLCAISNVRRIPAHLRSSENFAINIQVFQEALDSATKQGISVKAVVLASPNNPLGLVYPKQQLIDLYNWTKQRRLHLVVDEIYALSVYDNTIPFTSISSILNELGEPFGDFVHVVWSFSKDFCLSGFRVGFCYSENKTVLTALNHQSGFFSSSNYVEHALCELISDDPFIDAFICANQDTLCKAYSVVKNTLRANDIPFFEGAGAGFFVFLDLHDYLKENTPEGEFELLKFLAEEGKVFLIPGEATSSIELGWFRCCFASYPVEELATKLTVMAEKLKARSPK